MLQSILEEALIDCAVIIDLPSVPIRAPIDPIPLVSVLQLMPQNPLALNLGSLNVAFILSSIGKDQVPLAILCLPEVEIADVV